MIEEFSHYMKKIRTHLFIICTRFQVGVEKEMAKQHKVRAIHENTVQNMSFILAVIVDHQECHAANNHLQNLKWTSQYCRYLRIRHISKGTCKFLKRILYFLFSEENWLMSRILWHNNCWNKIRKLCCRVVEEPLSAILKHTNPDFCSNHIWVLGFPSQIWPYLILKIDLYSSIYNSQNSGHEVKH